VQASLFYKRWQRKHVLYYSIINIFTLLYISHANISSVGHTASCIYEPLILHIFSLKTNVAMRKVKFMNKADKVDLNNNRHSVQLLK